MVKRYDSDLYGEPMQVSDSGYYVTHDDYKALQTAFREALDALESVLAGKPVRNLDELILLSRKHLDS